MSVRDFSNLGVRTAVRILLLTALSATIIALQACGGSGGFAPSSPFNPSTGVTLQAIQVSPTTPFIALAETRQLRATGYYSDGGIVDITSQVTWSASSAPNPTSSVSVSSGGIATGLTLGSAVITAAVGPTTGLVQLIVDTNGYSSNTVAILSVPFKTTEVDAAYLPESQTTIQGTYAVQEVNLDADQFSSVLPVPSALLASIAMPPGFVPNVTVASPNSGLVAVISYSSPEVLILDASNQTADTSNNTVIATYTAPVSKKVTFNGITCMICAAVVNPVSNQLLLSTAQGYYTMSLTSGAFTALPFDSALPSPSFTLNPIAADPYIVSSTFGQNPPSAGEVQILDLTTNSVTNITNLGLTTPYASPIDLSSGVAAIVDAGATDQSLVDLTNPQAPTSALVSNVGACSGASGSVDMNMAALGIAANVNPGSISPTLFLSQPSGNCFGFEIWPSDPLDYTLVQYGYGPLPSTPDGNAFSNGSDPNAIATFNSVVDKKNYALLVDANQNWLAKINPQAVLAFTSIGTLPGGFLIPAADLSAGLTGDAVIYLPTPASVVTLSVASINFGNQAVGTSSAAAIVTLTNVSTNPLNPLAVSQISIQGTNAGDYAEVDGCTTTMLPPLGKCTINVFFTPSAAGPTSAVLSITDNGGASPQTVALSGTGT